ncbi:hypothetical protein V6N11_030918 [Hibiscus sabdariffa]|uniref:Uncharacterized protein n=1 Tax=Hibiscus sabdariffa TaxID=183260 RepID=A0ABR2A3G6_9ROSI
MICSYYQLWNYLAFISPTDQRLLFGFSFLRFGSPPGRFHGSATSLAGVIDALREFGRFFLPWLFVTTASSQYFIHLSSPIVNAILVNVLLEEVRVLSLFPGYSIPDTPFYFCLLWLCFLGPVLVFGFVHMAQFQ